MNATQSSGLGRGPAFAAGTSVCPVCGGGATDRLGALHGFPLLHCSSCGHSWLLTGGVDLAQYYDAHYAGFREDAVFRRRVREVLRTSIAPHIPSKGRVLDVGCGNGEFLVAASELGFTALGLDFSGAAVGACATRGVTAIAGDFLTHDFADEAPFVLISMWDVAEHLERPLEFVERARGLLVPGGILVLKVPCFTPRAIALVRRMPRLAGALLGSPLHVQYFRPEGLVRLLTRAGFAGAAVETPLAGMRGQRPAKSLISVAKRRVIAGIGRYCGNASALVVARAPQPAPHPTRKQLR